MRFTPAALAGAVILATFSGASVGAPARVPVSDLSRVMEDEGERLREAGQLDEAIGYFETALAADPRNANAYIGLGAIARAQDLPGKAITYYREALALDPEARGALAGQGEALVQRGAIDKARQNLARLQALCGGDACAEASALAGAINAGAARTALRAEDVVPRPVVESGAEAAN